MTRTTKLALPKTIHDLISECDQAIMHVREAYKSFARMNEALKQSLKYTTVQQNRLDSLESVENRIRAQYWQHAINMTGFKIYMDSQTLDDFNAQLHKQAPPFNEQTIRDTFLSAASKKDEYMIQGMIRIFRKLSPSKYKTNDSFKIGNKIITGFISSYNHRFDSYPQVRWEAFDTLRDLQRIFYVLDDKADQFDPEKQPLHNAVDMAVKAGGDYQDEYFKIRLCKNGNAHIWLLRSDLVQKVNECIAEYYGAGKLA